MPSLAMHWICYNGQFYPEDTQVFTVQNRGFRYGDGIFETIKLVDGQLCLAPFHFDRFFQGLKALEIEVPPQVRYETLLALVIELCQKNQCMHAARIRMAAFRGGDNKVKFVVEARTWQLPLPVGNPTGWQICLHPSVQKGCDVYANLKSANFLPYVLAARYAAAQKMDECMILNSQNHLCDGSRTNIFLLKDSVIHTPALHQGCVNGVMRRHVIGILNDAGYLIRQDICTPQDLLEADEVFCTNALIGIQPVNSYKKRVYGSNETQKIIELMYRKGTVLS